MKQEIALLTEWAWIVGILTPSSEQSAEHFAQSLAQKLKDLHPRKFGNLESSQEAIKSDVSIILKKLAYGGRLPETLHPKRVEFLKNRFAA